MSEIIKKEYGTEVEVFTADEVATKEAEIRNQAVEEYKAANPDKTGEVDALQEELRKANESLEGFKSKDLNFANLRTQKEAAEKKAKELKDEIDVKISSVKKEILDSVHQDHYSETLKTFAGEDAELKKKVEFHYKRLGDVAGTKEEINKKLQDAYLLATRQEDAGVLNTSVISSGGVSRLTRKSNQPFTPEEKAIGAKLALTPEDLDKFGQ